jgi:hypothetical protein
MGCEDVGGVVKKVANRDDSGLHHFGELCIGEFPLCSKVDVVLRRPYLIAQEVKPLLLLVIAVVENELL